MVRREGIARESTDDAQIVADMVARVRRRLKNEPLDLLINDCCFQEEKRLRKSKNEADLAYLQILRGAHKQLAHGSRDELERALDEIVRGYAREIHGHFDAKIYATATRVLPRGLALLLKRQRPLPMLKRGLKGLNLSGQIVTSGALPTFDKLVERGTCILVPTHVSNLDSPVIGMSLHESNLPPMIYGAGINLFNNWLLSYFMDHLGAYRVDRAKGHVLYKEVLKEYSQMCIERRWHSLFFPGGTRSRSGAVEPKLKKGLMSTGLAAYQANLRAGRERPGVFFIPATINYHLVLEAETLIDDHLQDVGKSRYIITDDEFSRPDRVLSFARNMLAMDNAIEVVYGVPLDPFGNPVNAEGESLDPQGRPFDPAGYVREGGKVIDDAQRDRRYTERLAGAIGQAFLRDSVLFETHILSAAMQRRLAVHNPGLDLYRRLLLPQSARRFSIAEVDAEIAHLQQALRKLRDDGQVRLGPGVSEARPEELRGAALKILGRYHSAKAVWATAGALILEDPRLTLYYANRLKGYDLPAPLPPAEEGAA